MRVNYSIHRIEFTMPYRIDAEERGGRTPLPTGGITPTEQKKEAQSDFFFFAEREGFSPFISLNAVIHQGSVNICKRLYVADYQFYTLE